MPDQPSEPLKRRPKYTRDDMEVRLSDEAWALLQARRWVGPDLAERYISAFGGPKRG